MLSNKNSKNYKGMLFFMREVICLSIRFLKENLLQFFVVREKVHGKGHE